MKKTRKTAIVLSLLFLFALLLSGLFIIAEADHDCAGEDCRICRFIALAGQALKGLSLPIACAAVAAAGLFAAGALAFPDRRAPLSTPVALKVKLSD